MDGRGEGLVPRGGGGGRGCEQVRQPGRSGRWGMEARERMMLACSWKGKWRGKWRGKGEGGRGSGGGC